MLTHHRLPCKPVSQGSGSIGEDIDQPQYRWRRFGAHPRFVNAAELHGLLQRISADWNEPREDAPTSSVRAHWHFPLGLPVGLLAWRKQAARYARKLLELPRPADWGTAMTDPFAMHVSRMCLMLADHHYSSIEDEAQRKPYRNASYPLYANTRGNHDAPAGKVLFNQTLDEHLLGVQAHAIGGAFAAHADAQPARLAKSPWPEKAQFNPRFQWQDKAADLAAGVLRAQRQGAFIVNMASTGCGKTLGNARIMNALADPGVGMRCAFAIGLRTLTLQTGRVFQRIWAWAMSSWPSRSAAPPAAPCSNTGKSGPRRRARPRARRCSTKAGKFCSKATTGIRCCNV